MDGESVAVTEKLMRRMVSSECPLVLSIELNLFEITERLSLEFCARIFRIGCNFKTTRLRVTVIQLIRNSPPMV
jgi:hypothetical protein